MSWREGMRAALLLVIAVFCLFGQALCGHCLQFREFQVALLSVEWMLLLCIVAWCGALIFLTFSQKDWLLIGLLLIAIAWYCIGHTDSSRRVDAIILLTSVTLGKGAQFLLKIGDQKSENRNLLVGLILLLAFASWWHLDLPGGYHGPRWMGLWNNPNIYGMLMGTGVVLAIGLLAINQKVESGKQKAKIILLWIAVGIMAVGLVMSYSRGAWTATSVALLYLAWCYGKLKWRLILPVILAAATVVICFWHSTADTAPWYLKRLDFSRPSAQHRVSAWRGALQIMRDHPLGVGWNNAIDVYGKNYSPPENGAAALTMNSYLMLGTELGLPGLLCFVAYVGLCFRSPRPKVQSPKLEGGTPLDVGRCTLEGTQVACHAAALVFVLAFWFDGGLFDLPTAVLFWILLELGTSDSVSKPRHRQRS